MSVEITWDLQRPFKALADEFAHDILGRGTQIASFSRLLHWIELTFAYLIETVSTDTDGITTYETLITYDTVTAYLVHRHRTNVPDRMEFKRDAEYPIGCIVRLR